MIKTSKRKKLSMVAIIIIGLVVLGIISVLIWGFTSNWGRGQQKNGEKSQQLGVLESDLGVLEHEIEEKIADTTDSAEKATLRNLKQKINDLKQKMTGENIDYKEIKKEAVELKKMAVNYPGLIKDIEQLIVDASYTGKKGLKKCDEKLSLNKQQCQDLATSKSGKMYSLYVRTDKDSDPKPYKSGVEYAETYWSSPKFYHNKDKDETKVSWNPQAAPAGCFTDDRDYFFNDLKAHSAKVINNDKATKNEKRDHSWGAAGRDYKKDWATLYCKT